MTAPEGPVGRRFLSFDATPVFYRHIPPEDTPKASLIIVHGMGEHGGRYLALAEFLKGLGIESWIPDLRGFGSSGGGRAHLRRFSDALEDLAALHRLALRQSPLAPSFLLGHSFGGLVCSSYLALAKHPRANGLILSSPIFGVALPVPFWKHWLGQTASYLAPLLRQNTGIRCEDLTHDPEILRVYAADGLIDHRISARLYRELFAAMSRRREIASKLKEPVLILQAGEDRVVSAARTQSFYDELAIADKELGLYPGLYHEILNETQRAQIYSRIGNWMLDHLDPKPLK